MHQLFPQTRGWVLFPSAAAEAAVGAQWMPAELYSDIPEKLSLRPPAVWALSKAQWMGEQIFGKAAQGKDTLTYH